MICEKAAVRHFKKENIFEILNLADRFNAKNLKVENLNVCCFLVWLVSVASCSHISYASIFLGRCVKVYPCEFFGEEYPSKQ